MTSAIGEGGAARRSRSRNRAIEPTWRSSRSPAGRFDGIWMRRRLPLSVPNPRSVSACEKTFLWAWANEAIPLGAQDRLLDVRAFGATHGLDLLTTAEWPAERAEGLEMLAVAGRVPDADGVFVDSVSDLTLFLVLHRFRAQSVVPWLI